MLYNASSGAVELSISCIAAGARLHLENEMFYAIMQYSDFEGHALPLIE